MVGSKIKISSFIEKEIYDDCLRLKERHEKLMGTNLSDSAWYAILIGDGLPSRTDIIERMENRRER